jgi:hypothetical protein
MNLQSVSRLSWFYGRKRLQVYPELLVLDRSQSNEVVCQSVSFGVLRALSCP